MVLASFRSNYGCLGSRKRPQRASPQTIESEARCGGVGLPPRPVVHVDGDGSEKTCMSQISNVEWVAFIL